MGRPPSNEYDFFLAPLVIIFNCKPETQRTADGKRHISYWNTAKRLLGGADFFNQITKFSFETLSQNTFKKIEAYIIKPEYNINRACQLSNALGNMVSWLKGIYIYIYSLKYIYIYIFY